MDFSLKCASISYLPDAVCDGPGEKDPGHDLESCQNHGGRHDSCEDRPETTTLLCKDTRDDRRCTLLAQAKWFCERQSEFKQAFHILSPH